MVSTHMLLLPAGRGDGTAWTSDQTLLYPRVCPGRQEEAEPLWTSHYISRECVLSTNCGWQCKAPSVPVRLGVQCSHAACLRNVFCPWMFILFRHRSLTHVLKEIPFFPALFWSWCQLIECLTKQWWCSQGAVTGTDEPSSTVCPSVRLSLQLTHPHSSCPSWVT